MSGRHVVPGRRPVAEALRAGRLLDEVVLGTGAADLDALAATALAAGIPVRRTDRAELDRLAVGVTHQGAVAIAPPFAYLDLARIRREADLVVVLDGVTDPQNLGSIARSAVQAGAAALVLPKRRSALVAPAAEKAAAGAFSHLQVALVPNVVRALADLSERGLWSVGLDGRAQATVWDSPLLDGGVALVVGGEGGGLSRLVAERCDGLVAIPTSGPLGSLNAGVAAAIALFEVSRRRRMRPTR